MLQDWMRFVFWIMGSLFEKLDNASNNHSNQAKLDF